MQGNSVKQNSCFMVFCMEEFTLSRQSLNYEPSGTPESFSCYSFFFSLTFSELIVDLEKSC